MSFPLTLRYCMLLLVQLLTYGIAATATGKTMTAKDLINQSRISNISKDSSECLLRKAIAVSRSADCILDEARAAYYLGAILIKAGRYDETLALLEPLVAIKHNVRLDSLKPHLYINISNAHLMTGNFREAIRTIELATSFASQYPPHRIALYSQICNVWVSLPETYQPAGYRKALQYILLAREIALHQKDKANYAMSLNNEGNIYLKLKEWDKCRTVLATSYQYCVANDIAPILKLTLITMGEMEYMLHAYDSSQKHLEQALLIDSMTGEANHAYGTLMLARTYAAQKKDTKAIAMLNWSAVKARAQKNKARLKDIFEIRFALYIRNQDYKHGFKDYKRFREIQDTILGKETAYEMRHLDMIYRETEKDKALLESELKLRKQGQAIQTKNFQIALLMMTIVAIVLSILFFWGRYRQRKNLEQQKQYMERLRAVVQGEELERGRIARELHDGIGGMLAVVGMHFSTAESKNFTDKTQIVKIRELLTVTAAEIRKTAHNLLPTALEQNDLAAAVGVYCNEASSATDIMINLEAEGNFGRLDAVFNITLFRIVQELIQNIIKHAEASHVVVIMELLEQQLSISVEDNGNGFTINEQEIKGIGIKNIKKRVAELKGTLHITSQAGIGTFVHILFKMQA